MSKRSDEDERKLTEQVAKAKPGFVPVRKARDDSSGPAAPLDAGTPDTPTLRQKSANLRGQLPDNDLATSTDALLKKFLPDVASDSGDDAPRRRGNNPKAAAPDVKGNPRIVSVRPTRDADSDEGIPPKDLQIVMDDEGQIGESS